jgi:hypothetical protein
MKALKKYPLNYLAFFFLLFLGVSGSQHSFSAEINTSEITSDDQSKYAQNKLSKNDFGENQKNKSSEKKFEKSDIKDGLIDERTDNTDKALMGDSFDLTGISPELLLNGNFENGQTDWKGSAKGSSGNWFDYMDIINSDSGGYGSWYAYLMENELLESNWFTLPINTTSLSISYSARLVHWGTCTYGQNGVKLLIWDETTDTSIQSGIMHDPNTDPYDYSYNPWTINSTVSLSSNIGHKISINFLTVNDDPDCTFALYLDNVSTTANTTDSCTGNICKTYRFANLINGVYLYTKSESEANNIVSTLSSTWRYEGVKYNVFSASVENSLPVYRFANLKNGAYLYTISESEKNNIINTLSSTWRFEGLKFYAYPTPQASTVPVYRFANLKNGAYLYTISESEKTNIINTLSSTWRFEGAKYYAPTN